MWEKEIVTDVGLLVREGGGEGKGDLHTKKSNLFPSNWALPSGQGLQKIVKQ